STRLRTERSEVRILPDAPSFLSRFIPLSAILAKIIIPVCIIKPARALNLLHVVLHLHSHSQSAKIRLFRPLSASEHDHLFLNCKILNTFKAFAVHH
ncbi:hypothetical protein, partial [Duffyella sp. Ts4]|uniref:hypothetical protein n=1 Tax=Duffyella sp. Ts4 TaxID=3402768 RepID=UPI003F70D5BB